ncbi:hypothetical protein Tco_0989593 [Tanacetum coccineum]|uniref:Uncharacterized protein n=1 Tax=Tanacetum coccineum TaxID=301880 RepID=A0ABQ5EUK5_9ASTR
MESVKKSINERALHKREYDSRLNKRHMHIKEGKVDTSKALNASLVVTESSRTESGKQYTSSRSGNDAVAINADIKPVYDDEPMTEGIDDLEIINIELEYSVAKLLKENETLKKHYQELYDSIKRTRATTIEHATFLIAQNAEFKAQLLEKGFAIAALKMS